MCNTNISNVNTPRTICSQILALVQILFQNNEIDIKQKDKVVNLLKESIKTNDMTEMNSYFRFLSIGSTMPDYFSQCIELTGKQNNIQ